MAHTLDTSSPLTLPSAVESAQRREAFSAMPTPAPKRGAWGKLFRFMAWSMVVVVALSAIAATVLMVFASSSMDSSVGHMWINGEGTDMANIMSRGIGAIVVAWFAVTGGLTVAFLAVAFAGIVTVLSLMFAAGLVGLIGVVLAAPALLILAFVIWVFRKAIG